VIIEDQSYPDFVEVLFAKNHTGVEGCVHAALGVAGEAGEIVDAIKKHWTYNKPLDRDHLIEEIGDLLFYLQALCNLQGITLNDAAEANVDKLMKRYPSGYSDAAALARADKNGEAK
jgi:NTP pyrophosphatase (non-canonical NTP hydrolase)